MSPLQGIISAIGTFISQSVIIETSTADWVFTTGQSPHVEGHHKANAAFCSNFQFGNQRSKLSYSPLKVSLVPSNLRQTVALNAVGFDTVTRSIRLLEVR